MPFVHEIQIVSNGYPGAPGYTNLYFDSTVDGAAAEDQFTAVTAFLTGIAGLEPTQWGGQINAAGRILEANTGTLSGFTERPATSEDVIGGTATTSFGAGVAGLVFGWSTQTIRNSRVVRGRTFVVPVAAVIFESNGTLTGTALSLCNDMAQALIDADVGFCIWSRPVSGTGGVVAPVTARRINDKAAFLTSRRG